LSQSSHTMGIASTLTLQLMVIGAAAWWVTAAQLPWQAFGFHPVVDVALAVLGAVATYAIAFWVCRRDSAFSRTFVADAQKVRAMTAHFTWPMILMVSILAGVGEELLFRVAMQSHLAFALGVPLAIALAALAFGAMHFLSRAYFIAASVLGLVLGVVYALTQSTVLVMAWHAVYDVIALAVLVKYPETLGLRRE
jgi:uncharacterized protein